jgi:hypothetical protein
MKALPSTLLVLACVLSAGTAFAQLKPAPRIQAPPAAPAAAAPATAQEPTPEAKEKAAAATLAASGWLLLLDRRDWGTAWDTASGTFRQTVPLGVWMDNVPGLRQPFGNFIERQPAEALYTKAMPGRPDGEYVTVHFISQFDRNAKVVETVTTVREPDGRFRVAGYTAR